MEALELKEQQRKKDEELKVTQETVEGVVLPLPGLSSRSTNTELDPAVQYIKAHKENTGHWSKLTHQVDSLASYGHHGHYVTTRPLLTGWKRDCVIFRRDLGYIPDNWNTPFYEALHLYSLRQESGRQRNI